MARVIILDAAVLIAYLDDTDPHHGSALTLLLEHSSTRFGTSALHLAETLLRPVSVAKADDGMDALIQHLGIDTVPILGTDAYRLAELRAHTGLKMPDCCVLLAAERSAATAIATFDVRLADTARRNGFAALPG